VVNFSGLIASEALCLLQPKLRCVAALDRNPGGPNTKNAHPAVLAKYAFLFGCGGRICSCRVTVRGEAEDSPRSCTVTDALNPAQIQKEKAA